MSTRRRKLDRCLIWASGPVAVTWANYPFLLCRYRTVSISSWEIQGQSMGARESQSCRWKVVFDPKSNLNPLHGVSFFWTGVSAGVALWLPNFPLPTFPRFSTFSCPINCPLCPKMHHLSSVPKPKLHWFLNCRAYRCSLGPGRFQNWGKKKSEFEGPIWSFRS